MRRQRNALPLKRRNVSHESRRPALRRVALIAALAVIALLYVGAVLLTSWWVVSGQRLRQAEDVSRSALLAASRGDRTALSGLYGRAVSADEASALARIVGGETTRPVDFDVREAYDSWPLHAGESPYNFEVYFVVSGNPRRDVGVFLRWDAAAREPKVVEVFSWDPKDPDALH